MVRQLQAANSDGTSLAEVVKLARDVQLESGITVDFEATPDLGQPLVVVRVPSEPRQPGASLMALTRREREVAVLIADGLSNKQIARRLRITLGTVKHYVHQILEKTGLPGRVAIATEARASVR
ncbi:MAG: response regulator transcription factor [Chloroflexi bacterium]|nr:MAG: response regulator transcription factor [Chloroflexota bacterium]